MPQRLREGDGGHGRLDDRRFTAWNHVRQELFRGGDGKIGERLTIHGCKNIALKENESHDRHEGCAFRHTPSNGVVA